MIRKSYRLVLYRAFQGEMLHQDALESALELHHRSIAIDSKSLPHLKLLLPLPFLPALLYLIIEAHRTYHVLPPLDGVLYRLPGHSILCQTDVEAIKKDGERGLQLIVGELSAGTPPSSE